MTGAIPASADHNSAQPTLADDHPNPFHVLGLPVTATVREIEREGQRRLALIGAGVADDCSPQAEFRVRHALDELRDARRRLTHEIRSPNLGALSAVRRELEPRLETLAATLPSATPSSYALAEALLWEAIVWPAPHVLDANHADERARAFDCDRDLGAKTTLTELLDYGELVAFHPPTRAARAAKKPKQRA